MYYYKRRFYNPELGRFISADPLYAEEINERGTDSQELNLYAYVRNNPIKYIDPSGKKGFGFGLGFSFVFGPVKIGGEGIVRANHDSSKSIFDFSSYSIGVSTNFGSVKLGDTNRDGYTSAVAGLNSSVGLEVKYNNADAVSQLEGVGSISGFEGGNVIELGGSILTDIRKEGVKQTNNSGSSVVEVGTSFSAGVGYEGYTGTNVDNKVYSSD